MSKPIFTETAVRAMEAADALDLESDIAKGYCVPGDSYGFRVKSRDALNGYILLGERFHRSRAEALQAGHANTSERFVFECVIRVRTRFEEEAAL